MGVWAEVMRRAGSAAGERDGVEASRDGQGGAEDPGHQLVSRVGMYGCAAGVSLVLPPAVLCAGRDVRTDGVSQRLCSPVRSGYFHKQCRRSA